MSYLDAIQHDAPSPKKIKVVPNTLLVLKKGKSLPKRKNTNTMFSRKLPNFYIPSWNMTIEEMEVFRDRHEYHILDIYLRFRDTCQNHAWNILTRDYISREMGTSDFIFFLTDRTLITIPPESDEDDAYEI